MPSTKFTAESRAVIVAHVRAGGSFAEGCREIGVRPKTGEGWLTRGRKPDAEAEYVEFAQQIEAAREEVDARTLSRPDLIRFMERLARKGSFQATKWLIEEFDRGDAGDEDKPARDGFDRLEGDELAPRRAKASA